MKMSFLEVDKWINKVKYIRKMKDNLDKEQI